MRYKFNIKNLDCAMCAKKIEDELNDDKMINNVVLNYATLKLVFDSDLDRNEVLDYVNRIARKVEGNVVIYDKVDKEDNNKYRIIILFIGIIIGICGMYLDINSRVKNILIVISYVILLFRTFMVAFKMIINKKGINENFLIVISVIGAYLIGEVHEGLMVIILYEVGKILEGKAIDNSRKSIKELMDIKSSYANLLDGKVVKKVECENLKIGDIIVVKSGEKIALDGVIVSGSAMIDSSALTGEARLVSYKKNDRVMSGMINYDGIIEVMVDTLYEESTVNKMLDLVENASNNKAKVESVVSKYAKIYTPLVIILSISVILFGSIFTDLSIDELIYRGLLFLVISCPCAIAISVPLSYFASIGALSKKGIIAKGSNYIDLLSKVNVMVFDKTGTVTTGKFDKLDFLLIDKSYKKKEIMEIVVKGELLSNHVIAKNIIESFNIKTNSDGVSNFKEKKGKGIVFNYNNDTYKIGNSKLCGIDDDMILVMVNDKLVAKIDYLDEVKDGALELFSYLSKNNIKTYLFTGDSIEKANRLKSKLKIDKVYANLMPEDKYKLVDSLIKEGNIVSFVGDGINDSASLALCHVGISMGSMGSESSVEASDVVIVNDNILKIISLLKISCYTNNVVKQNLIFAISMKVLFMVLGLFGIASMWEAVFADVGVTVITILNSIKILKKRV